LIPDTLHVDATNDRVGIGTTTPNVPLTVQHNNTYGVSIASTGTYSFLNLSDATSSGYNYVGFGALGDDLRISAGGSQRMAITSSGDVGIGTTSPAANLQVVSQNRAVSIIDSGVNNIAEVAFTSLGGNTPAFGRLSGYDVDIFSGTTRAGLASRVHVNRNGNVGIGTTSPSAQLTVQAASTGVDDGTVEFHSWSGSPTSPTEVEDWPTPVLALRAYDSYFRQSFLSFGYPNDAVYQTGNSVWNFRLYTPGGATTASTASTNLELYGPGTFSVGALSKASGSFRIPHPLPEKAETHDLVHSFIEGPQADLIYRGRVTLVDGQASVNVDESAGMTEGTFVALCRGIQCFMSNESGWTAVRGSVTGNVLTIEAQDSACVDTVSWMVVGERQDQHMVETSWTDENGKVIVEPLTTRATEQELAESVARMEAARIEALEAN
jgi:hypothetical protein